MNPKIVLLWAIICLSWATNASATLLPPVTIEGREWLQPLDFVNTSWNDVSRVCDSDTGKCSGSLNGESLDSWYWASIFDVAEMINILLAEGGGPTLDAEDPDGRYIILWDKRVITPFFLYGNRFRWTEDYYDPGTDDSYVALNGITRTILRPGVARSAWVQDGDNTYILDIVSVHDSVGVDFSRSQLGHFFYRELPLAVPIPATGWLASVAMLALMLRGGSAKSWLSKELAKPARQL